MRLIRFVRELATRFPRLLAANAALLALANLFDVASTLALAPVVDILIHPDLAGASPLTLRLIAWLRSAGLPVRLETLLGMFLALFALTNLSQIVARWAVLRTKYAVLRDLYTGTFSDFFQARWPFFFGAAQGTLINTFLREIGVVGDAFGALALFLASGFQLSVYLALPMAISWKITSLSLLATGLCALPFLAIGRASYRLGKLNTEMANRLSAFIQENLSLAKIVLGFGNRKRSSGLLAAIFDEHVTVTIKFQLLTQSIANLFHPLGLTVLAVTLVAAHHLEVPLAETAVLLVSLVKMIPAVGQLATQKNNLDAFFPSYEQVRLLRDGALELRQPSGGPACGPLRDGLLLEAVTFAYPGREPVLRGVTIPIPKGKMVAIVGQSGAGKSTLIDVLLGFLEPGEGRVLVDGRLLASLDADSYRRRIGYVPQDSPLFNGTIRYNLLWAKENATEGELATACRRANAQEFIDRLPQGLDTPIGDRGVRLSGGQVQRIALARALVRKPDLLILDEATSALDTESERLIQQAIESLARDTTVVAIAHRISTIMNADRIFVLEDGAVIDEGSYAELMTRKGRFFHMAGLQELGKGRTEG